MGFMHIPDRTGSRWTYLVCMPGKTILLIDDDTDMLRTTSGILEQGGYSVIEAATGERAVELARLEAPDLVLCDITLPLMDGYDVLRELGREARTAEIPFIFLSAKAEHVDMREGRVKGTDLVTDEHFNKPYQAEELIDAVKARLERSTLFRKTFAHGLEGLDEFLDLARGVDTLKDLSKDRRTRQLKDHEIIFRQGEDLQDIPYIVKGKVRAFKVNKDGKELTTALYGTGDFIGYQGLLEDGQATECAETLEDSQLALIPQQELLALLQRDHDVSMCFIKLLARDGEEKRANLLQMAYASIRQRVAQSLLRIQERYAKEDDTCIGVRISREDLASVVGTATESLIRCLADLKAEKLISVDGREICILDDVRLQKLARV